MGQYFFCVPYASQEKAPQEQHSTNIPREKSPQEQHSTNIPREKSPQEKALFFSVSI